MMTFEDIVARIESLPPVSDVVLKIQQLYLEGAENVDVLKLIRLIESDSSLTANVLKFVNDPKFGFSNKISSISQAVTLLGTQIVYGLVVDYAIHEKLKADISAYGITTTQFNDICHLQSGLVLQWFSKIDLRDAQFLTPLALIMEVGKLIVSQEVADSAYLVKFRRGLAKVNSIAEYEYEIFDTTSYDVSSLLFKKWKLNPIFIEVLHALDFEVKNASKKVLFYRDILDVVRTAVNVRSILTKQSIKEAALLVEEIGLSSATFLQVATRMQHNYEERKGIR
jgi:HD-like signal output (HDOD) protein